MSGANRRPRADGITEEYIILIHQAHIYNIKKYKIYKSSSGPGSVVGIATAYGLYGPGIESRYGEIFRINPDRPWGPPSLLYNGYRVFPGGKVLPGRDADSF